MAEGVWNILYKLNKLKYCQIELQTLFGIIYVLLRLLPTGTYST